MLYYIGEVNKIKNGGTKFMKNLNSNNYMDSIYEILDAPEVEYNEDGIEYLDEPEDELFYDDGLSWADDITYLDEPEEENECYWEMGDDFIPLPQFDYVDEEVVVIDENYQLDEYEQDLVDVVYDQQVEEKYEDSYAPENYFNFMADDQDVLSIDIDNVKSMIQLPKEKSVEEEYNIPPMTKEDDKIIKAVAQEYLNNIQVDSTLELAKDDYNVDEDTSWVNDEDLFGNNIDKIIADNPNEEFVDEDFVDGSFEDWLKDNQ
jgi:hypothetical protein